MSDLYGLPRDPTWIFDLLDRDDNTLRRLEPLGGDVELKALSRLGGSATLQLDSRAGAIDWLSHRVRITYDPGIPGVESWPIATMMFTSPNESHFDGGDVVYDVTLLTKLAIIDEDASEASVSFAEGTPIIPAVVNLIRATGEQRIAVTPSAATLRSQIVFDPAESTLTIVNKLLEAAGYWSLWCDGSGQFRIEPYVEIDSRPVAYKFDSGLSIISPEWERTQDMSSVPNRFIVVGQGTDEEPPLVGVAQNDDPDSPFSVQNRGRVIAARDEGDDAADQAIITALAQRRLLDLMRPVAKIEAEHAIIPIVPNDLIEFRGEDDVLRRATVQGFKMSFEFDAQCSAEWREA